MDNGRPFRISGSDDKKRQRASRSDNSRSSDKSTADDKNSSKSAAPVAAVAGSIDHVATEGVQASEPSTEKTHGEVTGPAPRPKRRAKRLLGWLVAVIVIGAVLAGAYLLWQGLTTSAVLPGAGKYQAVTTVDGQIYFGKVKAFGNDYIEINDGYYLQPTVSGDVEGQVDTGRLVRLSNRLYGPDGTIVIPKIQISSFEVLDPDGQIVQMMGDGS